MTEEFVRTSIMHRKPHAPEHMVRIYDMGEVHVVCVDCGLHDWGDWGADESQYTVQNFKAKYGDRVLEVVTFESAEIDIWTCPTCGDDFGFTETDLTPIQPDGTRGHLLRDDFGQPTGACPGPVDGPVKGL